MSKQELHGTPQKSELSLSSMHALNKQTLRSSAQEVSVPGSLWHCRFAGCMPSVDAQVHTSAIVVLESNTSCWAASHPTEPNPKLSPLPL